METTDDPLNYFLEEVGEDAEEIEEEEDGDEDLSDEDTEDEDAEDEEEAEEQEEPQAKEPDRITVKVDGEEVEVTLDDLKRSYSGQAYIQRGMQEAAKMRQELQTQREQFAQLLQDVQERGFVQPPQPPHPDLASTDPIRYMQERAWYDQQAAEYQRQAQQVEMQRRQYAEQQSAARQDYLKREAEALKQHIPEFADPEKRDALSREILRVGTEVYGFTAEELQNIADHRAIRALADAKKWHDLQKSKAKVTEKAAKARPVLKAGNAQAPGKSKAAMDKIKQRARQGDKKAALALFLK